MAAVTSPARHAASLATSASSREPRRSKVRRAMEWLKPSSAPSSVTMSASVRARMQTPSCTSCQLGSLTTTRFTRTRRSDIVHPVSSSQLTETRDRVRSFGGYNRNSGDASGILLGGNLMTVECLLGTPYEPDWRRSIFFWEEVGEPLSRLDRTLVHFKHAGVWDKISGMVIGNVHNITGDSPEESAHAREVNAFLKRLLFQLHISAHQDRMFWT